MVQYQNIFMLSSALLLIVFPLETWSSRIVFPTDENEGNQPRGLDAPTIPEIGELYEGLAETNQRYGDTTGRGFRFFGPRWGNGPLPLIKHQRRPWLQRNPHRIPSKAFSSSSSASSAFGQTQNGFPAPAASQSFSASASFGPSGPSVSFGAAASFTTAGQSQSQSASFSTNQGSGGAQSQSGAFSSHQGSNPYLGNNFGSSHSQSSSFSQSSTGPGNGPYFGQTAGTSAAQSFAGSSSGSVQSQSSASSSSQQIGQQGIYGNGATGYGLGSSNGDYDLPLEYIRSGFRSNSKRLKFLQ